MIDYRIIGQRISRQRIKLKLSQEALAEKVGASANYISKIERGKEKPNLDMLSKICINTDMNLARLFVGVSEEEQDYLHSDFAELLKDCTPTRRRMIFYIVEKLSEFDELEKECMVINHQQ